MTIEEALENFDTGDLVSLAWLVTFVTENEAQVKKLLARHEVEYTGDPMDSINKIITLSGMRGSYFTGDLEDIAKEAHYFSLGNVIPKVKGFFGNVAGALSTVAGPIVTAVTGVPGSGAAATALLTGVKNHLKGSPEDGQGGQSQAPANIDTAPAAIDIANKAKEIAKDEEEDKPTFWEEHKKVIIGVGIGLVLLIIAIVIYLRWKKNQPKKDK